MSRTNNISKRIYLVVFVIIALFGLLGWRLYHIQIVRHDELLEKARKKYVRVVIPKGKRGNILDVDNNVLVTNKPCYNIIAAPCNFPNTRARIIAANLFAKQLGIDRHQLFAKFNKSEYEKIENGKKIIVPNQYASVANQVDFEIAEKLKQEVNQSTFRNAINFEPHYKRYYPKGRMLSNILGYVDIDRDKTIGVGGIESSMSEQLKPIAGRHVYEKDLKGKTIIYEGSVHQYIPAKDGDHIALTIKEPIQWIIEDELDKLVEKSKPKLVYCIVADPATGDILAMAQRPTFNPNDRSTFAGRNTQNLMGENIFEPGSTFKPFTVAKALDEGIIAPQSIFNCENGYWVYGGRPLRDTHRYNNLTVSQIIQVSSNIGTIKIALKLGDQKVYDNFKAFGFGSKTNLPLRPESRGLLPKLKNWSVLSCARLPIGQGIGVTPFQMIRAYCALANNGLLPELRIIDHTICSETQKITPRPRAKPVQLFKNPDTAKKLCEMLKLVCSEGTAKKAAIDGYYCAGKTGTSQKVIDGRYSNTKHVASFAGFAPADKPRFVMLIAVDEPQGIQYGGLVAAPMFASAGKRILQYLEVKPDYVVGSEQDPNKKRRRVITQNQLKNHSNTTPLIISESEMTDDEKDPDSINISNEENIVHDRDNQPFDEFDLQFIRDTAKNAEELMQQLR